MKMREMITRILEFGDLKAADSLVPLTEIIGVETNQTVQEAVDLIARHGYSRLPVYETRIDNVVGLLHHLDLLTCDGNLPVHRLMRPAQYVIKPRMLTKSSTYLNAKQPLQQS